MARALQDGTIIDRGRVSLAPRPMWPPLRDRSTHEAYSHTLGTA